VGGGGGGGATKSGTKSLVPVKRNKCFGLVQKILNAAKAMTLECGKIYNRTRILTFMTVKPGFFKIVDI
jgi:hypothetical protein